MPYLPSSISFFLSFIQTPLSQGRRSLFLIAAFLDLASLFFIETPSPAAFGALWLQERGQFLPEGVGDRDEGELYWVFY
jgi:hypothetical protein